MENQTAARSEQAKENPPASALSFTHIAAACVRCGGQVLYAYRDAVTAALIAVFTYTLFAATQGLARAAQIQSDDMKRSIAAVETAVGAAQKSADMADRALKSVERARLSAHDCEVAVGLSAADPSGLQTVTHVNIRPIIKNGGRLPALRVNGWSKFEEFDVSQPAPGNLFGDIPQSPYVGVGYIGSGLTGAISGFGVKIEQLEAAWAKKKRIVVCAMVEYDDGFDDTPRRRTESFMELKIIADPSNLRDRNAGSKIFQWLPYNDNRSKTT